MLPVSFSAHRDCRHGIRSPGFLAFALALSLSAATPALLTNLADLTSANAQELDQADPDAQLYLTADQLIYDNDNETVSASGNVQLEYDGRNVVADRVSYNQKTRRVKAFGNVEILEPRGNRIYAQEIDITDDFGEGFVNALRVETPDNTRVAAESAERFADQKTVFHHGVYTACEPCKEKPNRAPLWQIKAQKVIMDGVEKTVTYKHARFELWGLPIAYFPYFSHADSSVKRKSGFLTPEIGTSDEFGYWYRQSYFWATGDSHDLTLTASKFSKQGVLAQAAWRHQLENGFYSINIAGIDQQSPDEFATNTSDSTVDDRGMFGSTGRFTINPRWTFGWNVLVQSDNNFSRTYEIKNYTASTFTNRVFLKGLNDRSFFDLAAKRYLVQNNGLTNTALAFSFESQQPTVLPVLDYNYVKSEDVAGGEVSLDVNITNIIRNSLSETNIGGGEIRTHGIDGEAARASVDLGWKKTLTTPGGLSFTPSLSVRGDWTATEVWASNNPVSEGTYSRFMPTAGLEVSYPILAQTDNSSHVFEPIAQVFARPDLAFNGVVPNEDSQSLVFDASTLFQRDKFSGYDRIESGTRANIGLRYSGQFANGLNLDGLIGQSFHLAGENPYARTDDLVNAGENSGLESDRSDLVASLSLTSAFGLHLNTQARFDQENYDILRSDTTMSYAKSWYSIAANYTYIEAQPQYAFQDRREQVGFSASMKLTDDWRIFGSAQYNMESDLVVSDRFGLSYHDECFTFTLAFSESRSDSVSDPSRAVTFKIGFRTIGDYEGQVTSANFEEFTNNENF
ncbi:MAG: LPS assembly protein LptD [Rhizobiaceae bacterium]|nr:LPS assembly protein LptD [Rhizobiaceae bacterium]